MVKNKRNEEIMQNNTEVNEKQQGNSERRKSRILVPQESLISGDREQTHNDDEAERAALVAQDKGAAQFSAPRVSIRSSLGSTASINSPQKEHFQGCLKLFAENKINKDNAWNLQLIDFMTTMLKKHDSRMENLQIASTTLDASAKIYSFRVDAIHHDVLKMAGGLSKAAQNRRGKRADEEEGAENENPEENQQKKKDKRKKAAKSSLSTNPQSQLNADIEINECIDPFFAQLAATTGDMTSSNRAFNATLPIEDKTLALILRSDVPFLNISNEKMQNLRKDLETLKVKNNLFSAITDDDNICTPFHGFSILDWDPENEEAQMKTSTKNWVENNLNLSQQAMAFDMNADVEPLPQADVNGFQYDDDDHHADIESDEDEMGIIPNALKKDKPKTTVAHLIDMRPSTHGDGFLEYSYSTAVIGAWAGPSHWKLKNNINKGSRQAERQNSVTTVTVKKAVSKKKKQLDLMTEGMTFSVQHSKCPQYNPGLTKIIIGRKTLSHGTAWTKNFETPIDRGFNLLSLRRLNCKESTIVRPISEVMKEAEKANEVHRISDINNYDYNNDNDNSYCPNSQPHDDDPGWQNDEDGLTADVHTQNGGAETNSDMVEPPAKVAKIFIPYAMRAKKVDMKQLKHVTWKLLAVSEENKENELENGDKEVIEEVKETTFKSLYKKLPVKLSTNMKECLSVSLSLLAVLHLANEKGLYLKNNTEMSDFTIFKENELVNDEEM